MDMLSASLLDLPLASDSMLGVRDTVLTGPAQTPIHYPQAPPSSYYNPAVFKRLDSDTLFWIFYCQQGTPQQLFAAQELKKNFWRYHSRLKMWFQRHPRELPSEITPEFEKGTYIFWDFEKQWGQSTRSDFVFEYAFLV